MVKEKVKKEINEKDVYQALENVVDPELGIDIVSLGLIYNVSVKNNDVDVLMTLTFPGCPYGPAIVNEAENEIKQIAQVKSVKVSLTFEPAWSPERINKDVRAALNL